MKQCFYIIAYHLSDDRDPKILKFFLQEDQAIEYGRKFATRHRNTNVNLYKQLVAATVKLQFVEVLEPFNMDYQKTLETKKKKINNEIFQ